MSKRPLMSSPSSETEKKQRLDGEVDTLSINTIRCLAADMVQKANSGHPGAPMGCAPMAHVLFQKVMNFNPSNPSWAGRDRFVLSNGHACALQYCMLHLCGYDLSMDDLKAFRQLGSKTPGHPENFMTPGIEVSTGPLGQGISNAVGLAIAERHLAATFNREGFPLIDNYTYVITGDGCLQEGVSSEACSLAGHLGLGKLIVLYDDNSITIDGDTSLSFTESVATRYESYGWQVLSVEDGDHDIGSLLAAIEEGKACTDKPTLIRVRTTIGFGSLKEGLEKVHGAPLGPEDIAQMKEKWGMDPEASFDVPEVVRELYGERKAQGEKANEDWTALFASYEQAFPEEAALFKRMERRELPLDLADHLPTYSPEDKADGTRKFSNKSLNALAASLPELVGGSADLTGSNSTQLKDAIDFQASSPEGRYFRFGVREHGMTAIANGLFAYGFLRPFVATFLNFMGYAMGSSRLSALSQFGVIFIMTHDSIGLGEDGPTHQPVEMLEQLRSMPNMLVFRPCDGNEVSGSYLSAIQAVHTPSTLCFSRQSAPNLEGTSIEAVQQGAYVLRSYGEGNSESPDLVLVSSGTEVNMTLEAAETIASEHNKHVRVVSMPCCELFDQQSVDYKQSLFPDNAPVLSVEASCPRGWERYSHCHMGVERFGLSGPFKQVYEAFGLTKEHIVEQGLSMLAFYEGKAVPSKINLPPRVYSFPSHLNHTLGAHEEEEKEMKED